MKRQTLCTRTYVHGHDADCGLDGCYYFYIWRSCGNLEFRVKTRHFKMKISSRGAALDPKLAKGAPPPFRPLKPPPGEPPGPRTSRTISFSWTCQESSEIPPHYRSGGLISLTCKLGHHGSSRNGGARPDLRNARPSKNRSGSRPRRPSRPRRDNTRSAARAPAAHDARAAILPWCLLRLSAGPLDSISIDWATAKCL